MTIAPTEPASDAEVVRSAPPAPADRVEDGPGVALLRTLTELTEDLTATDPGKVAAAALRGRHAGSDEAELRSLAIEAAAGLIGEEPQYSRLAARLLTLAIAEEAAGQGAASFSASVDVGHREGLIADATAAFVRTHAARLDARSTRPSPTAPTTASATSACGPCTPATCCGTPPPVRSSRRRSTSCSGWPAVSPRTAPAPRWTRSPSCTG